MRALCTGISGSNRMLCLAALRRSAFERGQQMEIFNIGDYVLGAARELFSTDMPQEKVEQKLLDLPRSTIVQLRTTAFERVLNATERSAAKHMVLSIHGCFRWNKALMRSFSVPHIDRFCPDFYFSVIDSPKRIYDVLRKHPVWAYRGLTEQEVATWQDEELLITKLLAGYRGREFFQFDRSSDINKLYELLFGPAEKLTPIKSPTKSSYVTAVVTAISGSWARRYLSGFLEFAKKKKGKEIALLDLPEWIVKIARDEDPSVTPSNILDQPQKKLEEWRAKALNEVAVERSSKSDCIVLTHATFRHTRSVTPAFDSLNEVDTFNLLGPTHFVTLLENVLACFVRIQTYLDWKKYNLSLIDVAIWRDEEAFMTKFIADLQEKPHYLIPVHVPYEVFWNFLFEKNTKKAYLSYPITQMVNHVEGREFFEEKNTIYRELLPYFALIDPFDVQDSRMFGILKDDSKFPYKLPGHVFDLNEATGEPRVRDLEITQSEDGVFTVEFDGSNISLEKKIVECLEKHVEDQIVERDYSIIDQSSAVFVYYPVSEGSPGVISEIIYAYSSGKDTFVYWKPAQSPFLKSVATTPPGPFKDRKELLKFLIDDYKLRE